MPDPQNNKQANPALWVGGQRRKLVRRNRSGSGLPRSSTMPSLRPGLTTPASEASAGSMDSVCSKDGPAEDSFERHQPSNAESSREANVLFHIPRPAARYRLFTSMNTKADNFSTEAPSTSFTETPKLTRTNSRKKQNLFGSKKPKALERQPPPMVTSPLPVSTPSKAARFFGVDTGVDAGSATAASSDYTQHPQDARANDARNKALPIPVEQQRNPLSLSTRSSLSSAKQASLGDEALDSTRPQQTNADEATSSTKTLRLLAPGSAHPIPSLGYQNAAVYTGYMSQGGDDGNSSLSDNRSKLPRPHVPAASHLLPPILKRNRVRRRALKSLERMTPITEASIESLRPAFRKGETAPELSVISEHESDDATRIAPVLHKSYSEMVLKPSFELDKDDLSPTDYFYDEELPTSEEESEGDAVHPGNKVDLNRVRRKNDNPFHFRSPLQSVEDAYLDATEEAMRLEDRRIALARLENEKHTMDVKIQGLKFEQENMRLQLNVYQASAEGGQPLLFARNMGRMFNTEISMLPYSNDDSDREPTVHKVELVGITRITPGMVKVVQIPPRKAKMPASRINSGKSTADQCGPDEHDKKNVENLPPPLNGGEEMAEDRAPDPPPKSAKRQPALQKHQCISSGHIFHQIDLRTIPDDAAINSLEVRPYLQTYTGIRQHVKVSVLCEKCEQDCKENVWECEIAACRMAVCHNCAEDMKMEWRERAINSWKLY